jgi:capsule polysaccharide modification protein KpsS
MLLADSGNSWATLSNGGVQQEKPIPREEKNYLTQICMHFITQFYSTISSNVDEEAYSNSATEKIPHL